MKTKLLLLLFFGLITVSVFGKKVILFQDDFNNGLDRWTSSTSSIIWTLGGTNFAGGDIPELKFPSYSGNSTYRISSPIIDISEYREGIFFLSLKQRFSKNPTQNITITMDVSTNGGKTWKTVWKATEGFDAQEYSLMIDSSLINSDSLQFSFSIKGALHGLRDWLIDDVELYFLERVETKMVDLSLEKEKIDINEKSNISIICKNISDNPIFSIEMCYQIGSNDIISEVVNNLSIQPGDTSKITFSTKLGAVFGGSYTVKAWIRKVNATVVDPEIRTKKLVVSSPIFIRKTAMIEWFTGVSCQPCTIWHTKMIPKLLEIPGKYVCATYRMPFPGGDRYSNGDGIIKKDFYNVTGVPTFIIDGVEYYGNDRTAENAVAVINNAYEQPADISINGKFQIQDSIISLKIILLPYITGEYSLGISVNQTIVNYDGGNVYHTMMKMLPDGNGEIYSLIEGEPTEINLSGDLTKTKIDNYNDVEVAVFLRKNNSKSIIASKYIERMDEDIIYPPINFTIKSTGYKALLEWERHPDADTNSWFVIYRDGVKIKDSLSALSYIDEGLAEGIYTYYIAAKYGELTSSYQKKSVTITSDIPIPYNVVVDASDPESLLITWDIEDESNIAGYNIYREGTKINESLITAKQYNDNVLYKGELGYCYKITAVSANDIQSGYSDIVCSSPFAPTGIRAEQIYSDTLEVKIEWEKEDDILSYNIYRDSVKINEEPLTEAIYFDKMSETGNFCYIVTAIRGDLESEHSEDACIDVVGTFVIPKIYTIKQLISSTFKVELEWNMMTDLEIEDESYNVYRDGEKINAEPITSKKYIDTTIDTIGNFCYQVVFINNVEGKFSEEKCIEVTVMNLISDNISAEQEEYNLKNVIVKWSPIDVIPVDGYNIYRDSVKINEVLITESFTYTDSVSEFDTEYCYSVTAIIDSIECAYSEKSCVTLEGNDVGISKYVSNKDIFNIYPNPVKDILNIDTSENIKECNVYNINGKLIDKATGNINSISTKKWSSGVYIIELITEKGKHSMQIIKE